LNLGAVASRLRSEQAARLLIICAGTYEEAAYEDTLAAGALCDLVWPQFDAERISDSAHIARQVYLEAKGGCEGALRQRSRNARRLLLNSDLRDDVPFCFRRDALDLSAEMRDGSVSVGTW
jgi:phosphosulfolactate phosphohydrolase-like enzyme